MWTSQPVQRGAGPDSVVSFAFSFADPGNPSGQIGSVRLRHMTAPGCLVTPPVYHIRPYSCHRTSFW